MKRVKDILNSKPHTEVHSASPDTLVFDAIKLMSDKGIGALVVLEDGRLVGILSERDYLRKVALMGRSSRSTEVREIMTPDPFTVTVDESMEACMELMNDKRIRHLPVFKGPELVGVFSIGDLLRNIMEDQKHMIKQLEGYIRGETF